MELQVSFSNKALVKWIYVITQMEKTFRAKLFFIENKKSKNTYKKSTHFFWVYIEGINISNTLYKI